MIDSNLLARACLASLPITLFACSSNTTPSAAAAGSTGIGGTTASTAAGGAGAGQAGIGGNTTAGSSGASSGSLQAFCAAQCDERYRCGTLDVAEKPRDACIQGCVNSWGPVDVYRGDVFAAMQTCLQNLSCSTSIDDCNIAGASVVSSDPENDPRMVSCLAKTNSCSGSANPFNDDICLAGLFLTDANKPAFDACMNQPCDTVLPCFDQMRGQT